MAGCSHNNAGKTCGGKRQAVTLTAPLFPGLRKGIFRERPNRFVIRCDLPGEKIEAYLPNPGRLWELLLPGRIVYIAPRPPGGAGRLSHMAVAVEREGTPLLLHTHANNTVAEALIRAGRIPGLSGARLIRPEIRVENSRFDFLLEREGKPFYLEVKSCTLVGRRIAMFPDAVTLRGKRHLEELAAMNQRGIACGVLFLIHWGEARYFLPDYHTDLAFAQTFAACRDDLRILAAALRWQPDLSLAPAVHEVRIPWETLEREARDAGDYLFLLRLPEAAAIPVGSLGTIPFSAGYYLYVGSARRGLTARLKRHLHQHGKPHWHIDYLKDFACSRLAIPIRSSDSLEHELAQAVDRIADGRVTAFGSSDCSCPSHLFRFTGDPLKRKDFIDLLQRFRIDRLEQTIAEEEPG